MVENNIINLKEYKNLDFLGGEENEVDWWTVRGNKQRQYLHYR